MNYYLIRFVYGRQCETETVLVREETFEMALTTIRNHYANATRFENLTFDRGKTAE
jgi:hypothetical protein